MYNVDNSWTAETPFYKLVNQVCITAKTKHSAVLADAVSFFCLYVENEYETLKKQ